MTSARSLPRPPLRPAKVEAHVFRCPIATPVRTSFGVMRDRPAVFVRVEDGEGAFGWGEVWCNFPACGAEHRARLVETLVAPLLTSRAFDEGPAQAFDWLSQQTAVLAIQTGEHGPIAQAIAGVDLALWDLCARRAGQPLWRFLGGEGDDIPVYASGINPDAPERIAAARRDDGYRAFKLKVGFGAERDIANLRTLRDELGHDTPLMVDANQGWDVATARAMAPRLAEFGLAWLEEPLRADRPWTEWEQLARDSTTPLAGGENIVGLDDFDAALAAGVLRVVQPDVAKWGGISACWTVAQRAIEAGRRYCPHYLGAGLGLLASGHLLAAVGGDGMLEVDANPNPLRSEVAPVFNRPRAGRCELGEAPGLGVVPDLQALAALCADGA